MRRLAPALAAAAALLAAGCSAGTITAPRYVLSIGVGDYGYTGPVDEAHPDPILLKCPAVDAQSLSDLLVSKGYVRFSLPLKDSDATYMNIKSSILSLSTVESNAIVVIFFSGHGTYYGEGASPDNEGAYLVPYDAVEKSTGNITPDTAPNLVSTAELGDWLAQAGTRNVIAILNTCYSGGFVDPHSSVDTAPQNYGIFDEGTTPISGVLSALGSIGELVSKNARDSGSPGPIVISAAGSRESTFESYSLEFEGHGLFPFYLLKAAREGDLNSDGFVTATEAYTYAVANIKLHWNTYAQFQYERDANLGIDVYYDFMPHISGGARDLVLFSN